MLLRNYIVTAASSGGNSSLTSLLHNKAFLIAVGGVFAVWLAGRSLMRRGK